MRTLFVFAVFALDALPILGLTLGALCVIPMCVY